MAEALSRSRRYACVLLLTACAASAAFAQGLADPTRPALPVAPAASASGPAASSAAPQVGVGMVVTAKEGVMALFDGRILRVGSRTESGVVTHIAPDAVVMRAADGKLTRWPLYPAVSVQREQAAGPARAGNRQDRSVTK